MSTIKGSFVHIFERIREERERLGFTQDAFGAIGGVSRRAQSNYESGERSPDLSYLAAIERVGVDVLFVITGKRAEATITGEEELVLKGFRLMDSETKRRTLAMVYGGTPPAAKQVFHGAVHQAIEGGAVFNESVKFDLGEKK